MRAFFPKGNVAKVQVQEGPLAPLPHDLTASVADGVRAVLVRRFGALPPLGKVWVDEALKPYLVPFARRSASKSLRTVARGSRLDLPEGTDRSGSFSGGRTATRSHRHRPLGRPVCRATGRG